MNIARRLWSIAQAVQRRGGIKNVGQLALDAPKYVALYRRLLADPRVPRYAKGALLGAGVFAVSPLNIPAYIPVIGALDDLAILLLAHDFFMKRVPADVLAEARAAVGLA